MLSQLKNYFFGTDDSGALAQRTAACNSVERTNSVEDDWILVNSQDIIGDAPSNEEEETEQPALEESWILANEATAVSPANSAGKARRGHGQPKGTKPRRWRGRKTSGSGVCSSLDEAGSAGSSIAIVPTAGPLSRPAAPAVTASAVMAASHDAKQVAAISAARTAKVKADKRSVSRNNLIRGNKTVMAAAGRNNRRSHLIVSRLCGSNNNRSSHKY